MDLKQPVPLKLQDVLNRIEQAEKYYKSLTPLLFIRLKDSEVIRLKRTHTAETFVKKFLEKFNKEYITVFKESKKTDTHVNCRRSVEDIYRIAYSYFGDRITLKDIIIELTKAVDDKLCATNWCTQILKTVYKERGNTNGSYYNAEKYNELGLTKAHYDLLK